MLLPLSARFTRLVETSWMMVAIEERDWYSCDIVSRGVKLVFA